MKVTAILVFFIFLGEHFSLAEFPTVSTKLGDIKGVFSSVLFQSREFKVKQFLGIPYAMPPVGKLRFKKPEPMEELTPNPFPATSFGPACAQVDMFDQDIAEDSLTEDCLFLNVYVPVQEPDKVTGHAVMVYIHGGGFSLGTGNRYIGDKLSTVGNVIVVTINYRLWIWGFLDINDDRAPGNMGLWDQHIALKWVNKNIGSFGGDKNRVTIFGQSAGAISAGLQALYPKNEGLFQNVITESGSPNIMSLFRNINENIQPATNLAKLLNCSTENKDLVFDCIQKSDSHAMFNAFNSDLSDPTLFWDIIFTPTIDGDFLKRSPAKMIEESNSSVPGEVEFFRSLSFINGLNGDEGGMWLNMIDGKTKNYDDLQLSREDLDNKIIPSILPLITASVDTNSYVLKRLISSKYKNWKSPYEYQNVRKKFVQLMGDIYFNIPCIEIGRLHANGSNPGSYLYRFTAGVERHLVPTPRWVDSGNHADELGPVFGYQLDYEPFNDYKPPEWELDLSQRIMTFWTNFAKYSNPNGQNDNNPWPKYTIGHEHYINFDRRDHVGQYLHAEDVDFWREIVPVVKENCHEKSSAHVFSKIPPDTCSAENDCN